MAGKKKPPVKKKAPRGSGKRTAAKKREVKKARVARKQPAPKPAPEDAQAGRPTDYRPEYAEAAYRLCLLGATDDDLAERFGVVRSTIALWKEKHAEFSDAIARGKAVADADVAHALYERATGAKWEEGRAFKVKTIIYGDNGRKLREEEDVRVVQVECGAPPDTNAAKLWLTNRRPDRWKEKIEIETKNTPLSDRIKNARKRLKEEGYKHV